MKIQGEKIVKLQEIEIERVKKRKLKFYNP